MQPRRILVRLPTWVGDAVMATPALRALRGAHPEARLALEGPPALRGLLQGVAGADAYLPDSGGAPLARARRLRAERFDWAVLLPDSPRAALGPYLAGIPLRAGYARDPLRRALLTERLDAPRSGGRRVPLPMVERYLAITRHLGCADRGTQLELHASPEAARSVDAALLSRGVEPDRALLVVAPGARFGSSKLWPAAHFARACDEIARRFGLLPVIAPGPGEADIARAVAERMDETHVALCNPIAGLEELVALVARARLLLSNDTGPRQIAVALGRPVVVLMGPTDPRHTAQHLERQRVLREDVNCSPCHNKRCPIDHRCMTRLAPERAVAAAAELLA